MGNINGRVVTGSGRINGGAFTLTVPATGTAALLGTANVFTALNTFQAQISSPDTGQANSERFGSGATVAAANTVAVGAGAAANGVRGTAVGQAAAAATDGTAVGQAAAATGGLRATALGSGSSAGQNNAIALGHEATTTAVGQFVAGSNDAPITTAYLGNGVTNAAPSGIVINATGGSGTDIAGAAITIAAGRGTGTGAPGRVVLQNAPAGSTGASLNTLRDRWSLEAAGNLATWQQTDTQTRQVGSITPTFPTATDASRKGRIVHTVYDTAEREAIRIEADGAAPMIGFLGAAAVVRAAHIVDPAGGGTVDAEARTAINAILVVLENLGFNATS